MGFAAGSLSFCKHITLGVIVIMPDKFNAIWILLSAVWSSTLGGRRLFLLPRRRFRTCLLFGFPIRRSPCSRAAVRGLREQGRRHDYIELYNERRVGQSPLDSGSSTRALNVASDGFGVTSKNLCSKIEAHSFARRFTVVSHAGPLPDFFTAVQGRARHGLWWW